MSYNRVYPYDSYGADPLTMRLHEAAAAGYLEAIDHLVEQGVDEELAQFHIDFDDQSLCIFYPKTRINFKRLHSKIT